MASKVDYTRRDLGKLTVGALSAATLLAKPNSNFGGVHIGINAPYSFRRVANSADEVLDALLKLGLSTVELRSQPVEVSLGAPEDGRTQLTARRAAAGGGAPRTKGAPRRRRQMTPEDQAVLDAATEDMRKWRLSASMDGFKTFRKKYEDAGVSIDIVKFDSVDKMVDDELDYMFQVAKALGARFITCEPPLSTTKRIGAFAEKHKLIVGYHGHAAIDRPESFAAPQSWETAMGHSKYNGANVDIGHFTAGNGYSPAEFIKKYHSRISNIHVKDRKKDQGANVLWGEGDTPIKEILQLMKREKYDFMATIEMEHPIPEGSDVMTELAKCIEYCKQALA